ncbi:MAG: hypothetical protein IT551_08820 [Novosphingobium sp.]|nr:hypothetical protein [Novosphingobium sp.]
MNAPLYSTLEGLKRRAKRLKKETGCTHVAALNQMARMGGYDNFVHASRALSTAKFCNDCGTEADCDNATELCFDCFTSTFPQSGEADFQP